MFIGTLGITPVLPCVTVEFDQLRRSPTAYEKRCVCVAGVTEGDGINFALFRPSHRQAHRTILVVNKQEPSRYKPVDGHWVKICGIVTLDEQRHFACKLLLQSAQVLDKRPIPGRRIFGVLENEGPEALKIETINNTGNEGMILILRPGEMERTVITDGKVRIFAVANDLSPTELLSTFMMPTVKSSPNYFERSTRTFYFSLRDGKMSLLEPAKATGLRKRWEATRE